MNAYESTKESFLPWVGKIPAHWKITRMKNILQNVSEKNHPDATVLSLYREYGVLPKSSRDDNHNVTSLDTASYKYVRIGELVINKMKAWQGSLGVSDYEGIVSPAYYVCKFTTDDVDKKYFHYLLRCKTYAQEFERLSTGMRVGQWDLGIDDFMCIPALIPPKSEQTAIAKYLDDQCAKIDALIAESKESIEEYKQWKASLVFEAVTKGLDPNVELKDSGIKWIGKMPTHWRITKIKNEYNTILGKMLAPVPSSTNQTLESYLCAANIKWSGVNTEVHKLMWFSDKEKKQYRLLNGDVLVMEGGMAGTACIYRNEFSPCYFQNSVQCCRAKDGYLNQFLYYWLFVVVNKGYTDSICNRATIQHYTKEKIENTPIPDIPYDEQSDIILHLDKHCSKIDALVDEKETIISELKDYKNSLIYEVVTGKRKVV